MSKFLFWPTRIVLAVCVAAALSFVAGPSMAQAVAAAAPAADTSLWGLVSGPIFLAASAAVGTAITWMAVRVHQVTGVTIDQKYQDDLHRAADTGIHMALNRIGVIAADQLKGNDKLAVLGDALKWVNSSVPGALAYLGVTPQQVSGIVASKLQKVITANVTPDPGLAQAASTKAG